MTTLDTAHAAYLENADYDATGSAARAKAFRTACRQLLLLLPAQQSRGAGNNSQQLSFRIEAIEKAMQEVEGWLAVEDGVGSVVHPDFSTYRV